MEIRQRTEQFAAFPITRKLFSGKTVETVAERFHNSMAGDSILVDTLDGEIAIVHLGWHGDWQPVLMKFHDKVEGYSNLSVERKRMIVQIIQVAERVAEPHPEAVHKYLFQMAGEDSAIARRCYKAYQEGALFHGLKYRNEGYIDSKQIKKENYHGN